MSNDNNRITTRRRVLKAGVLVANNGYLTFRCTVRDLSETGARVVVDDAKGIPDHFELLVELDGLRADCTVVRRKGNELGLRFLAPPRHETPRRSQVVMSSLSAKPTLRRKPPQQ